MVNGNSEPRPWKYTDDIIAGVIIGAWVIGKFIGVNIPDEVAMVAIGYVFGKNIPNLWRRE